MWTEGNNTKGQNISWMAPSQEYPNPGCQQVQSSEYVTVMVCMTLIFILLLGLYIIFFKWVFEVSLSLIQRLSFPIFSFLLRETLIFHGLELSVRWCGNAFLIEKVKFSVDPSFSIFVKDSRSKRTPRRWKRPNHKKALPRLRHLLGTGEWTYLLLYLLQFYN